MPSGAGYTWTDELDAIIRDEAAAAGVPLDLAYALIAAESGFDPLTHVDNALEDSVGLLELNRRGGQGAGYSVAQLQDPSFNLRLGLPPIRRAFETVWRPDIDPFEFIYQVATRSGHPGPVARDDPRIIRIATLWSAFYGGVGVSLFGPAPVPGAGSGGGPALSAAMSLPFSLAVVPVLLATFSVQEVARTFEVNYLVQRTYNPRTQLRAETLSAVQRAVFPPSFSVFGQLRRRRR